MDPPIHARPSNADGLISITSDTPIGLKCHRPVDLVFWRRAGYELDRLLVLERAPSECISSQVYRSLRRRWRVSDGTIRRAVENAADIYFSILYLYKEWPAESRLKIGFEHLVKSDEAAMRIIRFADGQRYPSVAEIARLREISRESQFQGALGRPKDRLYRRVRDAVEQIIPDDVMTGFPIPEQLTHLVT